MWKYRWNTTNVWYWRQRTHLMNNTFEDIYLFLKNVNSMLLYPSQHFVLFHRENQQNVKNSCQTSQLLVLSIFFRVLMHWTIARWRASISPCHRMPPSESVCRQAQWVDINVDIDSFDSDRLKLSESLVKNNNSCLDRTIKFMAATWTYSALYFPLQFIYSPQVIVRFS